MSVFASFIALVLTPILWLFTRNEMNRKNYIAHFRFAEGLLATFMLAIYIFYPMSIVKSLPTDRLIVLAHYKLSAHADWLIVYPYPILCFIFLVATLHSTGSNNPFHSRFSKAMYRFGHSTFYLYLTSVLVFFLLNIFFPQSALTVMSPFLPAALLDIYIPSAKEMLLASPLIVLAIGLYVALLIIVRRRAVKADRLRFFYYINGNIGIIAAFLFVLCLIWGTFTVYEMHIFKFLTAAWFIPCLFLILGGTYKCINFAADRFKPLDEETLNQKARMIDFGHVTYIFYYLSIGLILLSIVNMLHSPCSLGCEFSGDKLKQMGFENVVEEKTSPDEAVATPIAEAQGSQTHGSDISPFAEDINLNQHEFLDPEPEIEPIAAPQEAAPAEAPGETPSQAPDETTEESPAPKAVEPALEQVLNLTAKKKAETTDNKGQTAPASVTFPEAKTLHTPEPLP